MAQNVYCHFSIDILCCYYCTVDVYFVYLEKVIFILFSLLFVVNKDFQIGFFWIVSFSI